MSGCLDSQVGVPFSLPQVSFPGSCNLRLHCFPFCHGALHSGQFRHVGSSMLFFHLQRIAQSVWVKSEIVGICNRGEYCLDAPISICVFPLCQSLHVLPELHTRSASAA